MLLVEELATVDNLRLPTFREPRDHDEEREHPQPTAKSRRCVVLQPTDFAPRYAHFAGFQARIPRMPYLEAIEFRPTLCVPAATSRSRFMRFRTVTYTPKLQGLTRDVAPTYATSIRPGCPKICVLERASAAPTYAFLNAPQLVLTLPQTAVMKRGIGFLPSASRRVRRPNLCVAGTELFAPRYA